MYWLVGGGVCTGGGGRGHRGAGGGGGGRSCLLFSIKTELQLPELPAHTLTRLSPMSDNLLPLR
jgi:hypothetical protein